MIIDRNGHIISKNCEWKVFVTHLNNFWSLTPYISKSPLYTPSIYVSWLIKSSTRNPNRRWKPKTEVVLTAILTKNRKNVPKLDFGLLYLENSPTYDTDMYVVFDKVDKDEFESEEKTGSGSSFSRHFDENPLNTAKISAVFRHICGVAPPTYFTIWKNCLHPVKYTSVDNSVKKFYGVAHHFLQIIAREDYMVMK